MVAFGAVRRRSGRGAPPDGDTITALDGRQLGAIELFDDADREFTDLDEAVLAHVAQMASAAIERAQLYHDRR